MTIISDIQSGTERIIICDNSYDRFEGEYLVTMKIGYDSATGSYTVYEIEYNM